MAKKKEKITYVDDGRTLADMSGISGPRWSGASFKSENRMKGAWKTYWSAVKMMFFPMLAVIGALVVIYAIMYLLFSLA